MTDAQAERLWARLAAERRDGASVVMDGAEKAVAFLSGRKAPIRKPESRARKSIRRPKR